MNLSPGEKVGLVLGLTGALVGVVISLWVAVTDFMATGGLTTGGMVALVAGVIIVGTVWLGLLDPLLKNAILQRRGQPAEATILKMWDTGVTINKDPQVGLLLEIRPPGQPPIKPKPRLPSLAFILTCASRVWKHRFFMILKIPNELWSKPSAYK